MKAVAPSSRRTAFTLVELLAVIAIIGIIAAIVAPSLNSLRKGDVMLSSTRQVLDAVARARQLAISQRTTVYLVFVPPGFWNDPAYAGNPNLTTDDRIAATNLAGLQYIGYNFIALRGVGDQPGQGLPRYLSSWQTLPEGTFIAVDKFWNPTRTGVRQRGDTAWTVYTNYPPSTPLRGYEVYGFEWTTNLPFPLPQTRSYTAARPYPALPYIAFDYLGRAFPQVTEGNDGEFVPLAHGGTVPAQDPTTHSFALGGAPPAAVGEVPVGNSSNAFNLIHVDWLTGRGRLEQREVQ